MFIVHSTVKVPIDKTEEVIDIYRNRSRQVDQAEGFHSFELLQNDKSPEELTVQIKFTNKKSYLEWVRSDDFKRIHELEKKYPDKELADIIPKVQMYSVVAT
ncbi:antibiotic biosynthesis monooxygenase family protein [Pseudalkalibacillus berkeleyi]|uniref:Antibiotic biosynthesis monooxygenase n=1 Tax=Pseudalkalibacillus berkeleyi TaxID=1069813 RepID=A0ABS9H5J2_9BACL|nr:antibiotic biosynthesis monooxygenase family protein [Pseudalkalibacillus berkeleyi]MCF6139361.1 antibiotic biosynthesis monooxygenase [Pseudalkalibacillus berkeleyi]